jgi:very-short-patch-repair endonuclease
VKHQFSVEIDGGIHQNAEQADYDRSRTDFLEMNGLRELRFTNEEIENNLPEVLNKIIASTSK